MKKIILASMLLTVPSFAGEWALIDISTTPYKVVRVTVGKEPPDDGQTWAKAVGKVGPDYTYDGVKFTVPISTSANPTPGVMPNE